MTDTRAGGKTPTGDPGITAGPSEQRPGGPGPTGLGSLLRTRLQQLDARLRPDLHGGWTGADLPDQTGRTWLVTGATHGIGEQAARALAVKGARLLLPARSVDRANEMLAALGGNGMVVRCDLADPASVRSAADQLDEPIDVLADNAGVFATRRHIAAGGHELMWQTNVLGAFTLTNLVLPLVRERIVITGSDAHRSGRLVLDDVDFEHRRFNAWSGYAQSKLGTMVWAHELDRRLRQRGSVVRVQVGQPGWAATNLQRNPSESHHELVYRVVETVAHYGAQSAEAGAWPLLYAGSQDLPDLSYVSPSAWMRGHPVVKPFSRRASDPAMGRRLWRVLVDQTGTDLTG